MEVKTLYNVQRMEQLQTRRRAMFAVYLGKLVIYTYERHLQVLS